MPVARRHLWTAGSAPALQLNYRSAHRGSTLGAAFQRGGCAWHWECRARRGTACNVNPRPVAGCLQWSGGGKSTPTRSQWPPSRTYRADCGSQRCCRQPGSGGRAAFEHPNRIGHDSFAECSVGHSIGKEHRPPRGNLCYMYALRAARRLRGVPAGTARRRNAAFEAGGRARHWECRAARSARRIVHAGHVGGYPHRLRGRQCLSTCACEVPPRRICHMAPLGGPTARSRILAP